MDIRIDEQLWANSMVPGGILERWRMADGASVQTGQMIAEVRIEGCLHEIMAPRAGRLVHAMSDGGLIEPGSLIARIAA